MEAWHSTPYKCTVQASSCTVQGFWGTSEADRLTTRCFVGNEGKVLQNCYAIPHSYHRPDNLSPKPH